MKTVLICTPRDLEEELQKTVLFREDIERYVASRLDEARMLAIAAEPHMIVIDRELPGAIDLIQSLKDRPELHSVSIVVLSRTPFETGADSGLEPASALLTLPPHGHGWDGPLLDLMGLPRRMLERFAVNLDVETWLRTDATASRVKTLDLSLGGMLGQCAFAFKVGDDVDLRLLLPSSPEAVSGIARIVREAAPMQFGMQFVELEGDGPERLRVFLEGDQG